MSRSFSRWQIFFPLAGLIALIAIFPTLTSLWQLNFANAHIARALALPLDSPARDADLARAQAALSGAPESNPRTARARARVDFARGEWEAALNTLQRAPALDSDFIAQFIAGDAAYRAGDSARAFALWRASGALEYFIRNAQRARDQHLWQSAEENARIAAGIAPNLADADYILGDALARQDAQNPSALSALERAEILTQEKELLAAIISRRGEIYFAQGKFSAALEQFTRARAIAPLDARPRTGFALTMVQLEPAQRAQATALLQQVIADAPWYSVAYSALASFAEADQDFARTEQWFKTGLEKNPNEPHLLFARGQFYARQKRFQDARAAFIDALKFETHADDLQSIARALADLP